MERIAIINHKTHTLFIEDIDEEILNDKYNGEEDEYIKDNYNLDDGTFSWDYITSCEYYPKEYDPISVDFEELL